MGRRLFDIVDGPHGWNERDGIRRAPGRSHRRSSSSPIRSPDDVRLERELGMRLHLRSRPGDCDRQAARAAATMVTSFSWVAATSSARRSSKGLVDELSLRNPAPYERGVVVMAVAFAGSWLIGLNLLHAMALLLVLGGGTFLLHRWRARRRGGPASYGVGTVFAETGVIAGVLFLLLQVVPFGQVPSNPPVTGEPQWDSPQTRALVGGRASTVIATRPKSRGIRTLRRSPGQSRTMWSRVGAR